MEYLNHPLAVSQGKQSKLKINVSHMYVHTHKRMLASPGTGNSGAHPSLQKATKKVEMPGQHQKILQTISWIKITVLSAICLV